MKKVNIPFTQEVKLSGEELTAVMDCFTQYVKGYLTEPADDGDDGSTDMIVGWKRLGAAVGEKKALQVFWAWNNSLPRELRSDVDPDGN